MELTDKAKPDLRIEKGERTKAAILKEARRLLSERGFDGTSVKDITDAAGVPKSLFYHYFSGTDDLLKELADPEAILRPARDRLRAAAERSSAKGSAADGGGAKDAFVAGVFSAMSADPEGLRIVLGEALRRKAVMAGLLDSLVAISAELDEVLPAELEKGYDSRELAVLRLYTRFFPLILLALTEDEASRRLKIGKRALRELVVSALRAKLPPKEGKL
jgi:AcrR family transcriptional regulator